MKFKVPKSKLFEALSLVQNIVGSRSALPVLSNVLISAEEGSLVLTTTDIDITMRCRCEADVATPGKVTLPVKKLASIVRELDEGIVSFDVEGNEIAHMRCSSYKSKINGLPAREFPPAPTTREEFEAYKNWARAMAEGYRGCVHYWAIWNEPEGFGFEVVQDYQERVKVYCDLMKEAAQAIREVDRRHLVIVEGNGWGNNYNGFPDPWDGNLVMSFHKYWNPNTEEAIAPFLALREEYRLPIWLGESGENTNEWFSECVALVEKHGIGWAWWPYKKIGNPRCILTVTAPDDFAKVVAYWNGEGERPSREAARRGLVQLVENLKRSKGRFNAEVAQALIPNP